MSLSDAIELGDVRPLRREEYDRLVESGSFQDERVELLHGVIVRMSPQGSRHAWCVRRLTMLLVPAVAGRAEVQIQSPFAADDDSEPEPDVWGWTSSASGSASCARVGRAASAIREYARRRRLTREPGQVLPFASSRPESSGSKCPMGTMRSTAPRASERPRWSPNCFLSRQGLRAQSV